MEQRPVRTARVALGFFFVALVSPALELDAAPRFEAPFYAFPSCPSPAGFLATDVDADGRVDLLVRNGSGVFLMPGRGDLTFEAVRPFAGAPRAADMALADVNRDGNGDLVLAGESLVVLLADGAGGFAAPRTSPATGCIRGMTVADWTADGFPDVVLRGCPSRLFLGVGDGTFVPGVQLLELATDFVAGDFDEDGFLDLVTPIDYFVPPDIPAPTRVAVQFGHGDGTFGDAQFIDSVIPHPRRAATADFDLDGHLDLLVSSGYVVLARGDGRGGFGPSVAIGDGQEIAVADLDQDGRPDFVTDAGFDATASVFLARSAGSFESAAVRMGWTARNVQPIDLDTDGVFDLVGLEEVFGGGNRDVVIVARGRGDGRYGVDGIGTHTFGAGGLAVGDFSGDGRVDLAHSDFAGARILYQVAPDTWEPQCVIPATNVMGLTAGRIDGDLRADLAFTCWVQWNSSRLQVYLGAGNAASFGIGLPSLASLILADFDADGFPDFLVQGDENSVVRKHERALGPRVVLGSRGMARAADVDGDGNLDVITALPESRGNWILLRRGHGDFSFAPEESVAVAGSEVHGFEVADFDGDDRVDLAVAEASVSIFRGSGDGRFVPCSSFAMPYRTGVLASADFDADGDRDLAVGMPLQRAVGILWNRGDGSFESKSDFGAHDSPVALCVADADGDGDLDLFTGNEYLGTGPTLAAATLLLNRRPPPTPVQALELEVTADGIRLWWSSSPEFRSSSVSVQRAATADGPWTDLPPPSESETCVDRTAEPGTEPWYRVLLRATEGTVRVLGPRSIRVPEAKSVSFSLLPVVVPAAQYPVRIEYDIRGRRAVTRLAIYDPRGALVWSTSSVHRAPGHYQGSWDRRGAARGVYFVRLEVEDRSVTRKLVLVHR